MTFSLTSFIPEAGNLLTYHMFTGFPVFLILYHIFNYSLVSALCDENYKELKSIAFLHPLSKEPTTVFPNQLFKNRIHSNSRRVKDLIKLTRLNLILTLTTFLLTPLFAITSITDNDMLTAILFFILGIAASAYGIYSIYDGKKRLKDDNLDATRSIIFGAGILFAGILFILYHLSEIL